jgi:hypothetical protein
MHRAFSRLSTRLVATATALTLSVGASTLLPATAYATKTTFLGVEGDAPRVQALADALRWELGQRGRDDGNTMSLAELELTMGCGRDDVGCYAQGGQTLGSEELVYAVMTKTGGGFEITLTTVNVGLASVGNKVTKTLTDKDLTDAALAATATMLLNALYEVKATDADKPPEDTVTTSEPVEEEVEDEPEREGALIWGPYSPRPRWKMVGLGVMGGLTVAALGTAIGTTIAIGPNGPIRKDLLDAAAKSLEDDRDSNDVDPNMAGDLCVAARRPPNPDKPDEVTNGPVTIVCNKADNLATVATASWVATGVFAVATVAFTVLLFVHKDDSKAAARLHRRGVRLGGAPLPGGGFAFSGGLKF